MLIHKLLAVYTVVLMIRVSGTKYLVIRVIRACSVVHSSQHYGVMRLRRYDIRIYKAAYVCRRERVKGLS